MTRTYPYLGELYKVGERVHIVEHAQHLAQPTLATLAEARIQGLRRGVIVTKAPKRDAKEDLGGRPNGRPQLREKGRDCQPDVMSGARPSDETIAGAVLQ